MPLTNDHYKQVSQRPIVGRERRVVAGMAVLLVALIVVIAVSVAGGNSAKPAKGCLQVQFASSMGVQDLDKCGTAARDVCAAIGTPGGLSGRAQPALVAQCRRNGYPVG